MLTSDIKAVIDCVGKNKVIGAIQEIEKYSQFMGKKRGKQSSLTSTSTKSDSFSPFRYYKDIKTTHKFNSGEVFQDREKEKERDDCSYAKVADGVDHEKNIVTCNSQTLINRRIQYTDRNNQTNHTNQCSPPPHPPHPSHPPHPPTSNQQFHLPVTAKNIIETFMHRLDPMLSLCTKETEDKKIKQMLLDLSLNLNNGKQFFRKMGFSRRRNISASLMEKELTAKNEDGHMSLEVLQYLCNLCEINAILVDIDRISRSLIDGSQNNSVSNREEKDESKIECDHLIILCESKGERCIKHVIGQFCGNLDARRKDINRQIMSALVDTRLLSPDYLDSLKLHEIKRIYKLLTEDDSKNKGWKKESYVDFILGLKLKWERNEER